MRGTKGIERCFPHGICIFRLIWRSFGRPIKFQSFKSLRFLRFKHSFCWWRWHQISPLESRQGAPVQLIELRESKFTSVPLASYLTIYIHDNILVSKCYLYGYPVQFAKDASLLKSCRAVVGLGIYPSWSCHRSAPCQNSWASLFHPGIPWRSEITLAPLEMTLAPLIVTFSYPGTPWVNEGGPRTSSRSLFTLRNPRKCGFLVKKNWIF